jgi:nucleoside-diphosphate-sugar epimerase
MVSGREKVLVTGAAGRVARLIAPTLRAEFQLRRLDVVSQQPSADDELVQADVRDVDSVNPFGWTPVETPLVGAETVGAARR